MTLKLVSLGINSHMDMSLRALEAAKSAQRVYAETYTMKMDTTIPELEELIRKTVTPLLRSGIEEKGTNLISEAKSMDIVILVGGDALSATTHISLLLDAQKKGVKTQVIHGSSIFTAITDTGLSIYKFGKTVTIPFPEKGPVDTVLRTIKENQETGLHTLILLDLNMAEGKYLHIKTAINRLIDTGSFSPESLLIGVARLGSSSQFIKGDTADQLRRINFGEPPHALIAPGKLHFLEEDALTDLAQCPRRLIDLHKPQGELDRLISKYTKSCRKVLTDHETVNLPSKIDSTHVEMLLSHAERYIDDALYYWGEQKPVALTSVAYAEGILDALKLLGVLEFEW